MEKFGCEKEKLTLKIQINFYRTMEQVPTSHTYQINSISSNNPMQTANHKIKINFRHKIRDRIRKPRMFKMSWEISKITTAPAFRQTLPTTDHPVN